MKTASIICSRFKQYWTNHKSILILFLLGGTITALIFSYFYGNLVRYMVKRDSTDRLYRAYTIQDDSINFEIEHILSICQSDLIETIQISAQTDDEIHTLNAIVNNNPYIKCEKGSIDFTRLENAIVIPTYISKSIGDSIELLGEQFEIIGQHTVSDYYISIEKFMSIDPPIINLTVYAANRQHSDNDVVHQFLTDSFPTAEISTPHDREVRDESKSTNDIIAICFAYAVSLCSYMFLLRYLMDSALNCTIISIIVGATKRKIFTIVFAEVMILCATVNALGIVLHHVLYPYVFSHINLSKDLLYSPKDYIIIFSLMQLVGIIVAVPYTRKYTKLSPIESRRHID